MKNMRFDNHDRFILTPILDILRDTVNACAGLGIGIESQSLCEYVLQTTFLKMTGASEQKLKCICWEMATNDYSYRYKYLKKNYGECSSFLDKNKIYKDLVNMLSKQDSSFSVDSIFDDIDVASKEKEIVAEKIKTAISNSEKKKNRKLTEQEIQKMTKGMTEYYAQKIHDEKDQHESVRVILFESIQDMIESVIGHSLISQWDQHNYQNYKDRWKSLSKYHYAEDALLSQKLQEFFNDYVYAHRNRCAHNLLSFQNNLPTLKTLIDEGFVYDNYFFRFSMLILIDEVFVRLYKAYMNVMESKIE